MRRNFIHTHMNKADRALENVQNLYGMQWKLLELLESDLRNPDLRKEVKKTMKEFESLLNKADWRYMGGMDVWETLQSLPKEMAKKLRESSVSVARTKRPSRAVRATKTVTRKTVKAKRK